MLFYIILISLLINFNYISYNENLLLCILLTLFFLIIHFLFQKVLKINNFLRIYKNFLIILYTLLLKKNLNKFILYSYYWKKKIIKGYKIKIRMIKPAYKISVIGMPNILLILLEFLNIVNKMKIEIGTTNKLINILKKVELLF